MKFLIVLDFELIVLYCYKSIFDELQFAGEVQDVVRLEPFLRCMESVFYQSLNVKNLGNIKLSADPLLDSNGKGRKDIEVALTDACTVEELAKYVPSRDNQTNFPYSGELFWGQ